jgi:predicted NAD/FAD-binding protein
MNRLQSLTADRQFCVTLNRTEAIDPERVLSVREFSHPVFSHRALTAQRRWGEVSGMRRTHYCGAYWGYGFHEDGVQSARRVCERFGVHL